MRHQIVTRLVLTVALVLLAACAAFAVAVG